MGAIELLSQTLLLRELLVVFKGNELTIGIILASWMVAAALGAGMSGFFTARIKRSVNVFITAHFFSGVLLPVGLAAARLLRIWAGIPMGISVSYGVVMWGSFCVLLPFGMLAGLQFAFGCKVASNRFWTRAPSTMVYMVEACGFVLAGLLFAFLFSPNLKPLKLSYAVAALALASGGLLWFTQTKEQGSRLRTAPLTALGMTALFIGLSVSPIPERLEYHLLGLAWPGVQVESFYNSKFANILVIERGEERTVFINGIPAITLPQADIFTVEPLVQFPLLFHGQPQKMLAIGTGLEVVERVAASHKIDELHYVELDPFIVEWIIHYREVGRSMLEGGAALFTHLADARGFLSGTDQGFDVVVMNLGAPTSLQMNRLYTEEFFELCRRKLEPGGILAFTLASSDTYLSEELRRLDSSVLQALSNVFTAVRPIPGDPAIILASLDVKAFESSTDQLIEKLCARQTETPLFNSRYLRIVLRESKLEWFYGALEAEQSVKTNKDLFPFGTHYALLWEVGQTSPVWVSILKGMESLHYWLFAAVFLGAVIFLRTLWGVLHKKPSVSFTVGTAILTSGMTSISTSAILAFGFQIFFGYIYSAISLLTASFMLGLAAGALMFQRFRNVQGVLWWTELQLFLAPVLLYGLNSVLFTLSRTGLGSAVGKSGIFLLALWVGLLVGGEFAIGLRLRGKSSAGPLYALDLLGACIGGVVTATFLVPVFGIPGACLALLFVKLLSFSQVTAYSFGKSP